MHRRCDPRTWRLAALVLAAVAATAGASAVHAVSSPALPAQVVSITRPASLNTYTTADYGKKKTGTTSWRVVQGTGNCCGKYPTSPPQGRPLHFGGSFIHYTGDRRPTPLPGRPLTPLRNGEGA